MRFPVSRVLAVAALAAGFLLARRYLRSPAPDGSSGTPTDAADQALDRRLDEAVEETFPASDPIAVHIE